MVLIEKIEHQIRRHLDEYVCYSSMYIGRGTSKTYVFMRLILSKACHKSSNTMVEKTQWRGLKETSTVTYHTCIFLEFHSEKHRSYTCTVLLHVV